MKIYSHANYKGSLRGFQFADISLKGSTESFLLTDMPLSFPGIVRYWCEQKAGWKLILQKIDDTTGILLFGRMERARELDLKQAIRQAELSESIRKYNVEIVTETPEQDLFRLESNFYITLAFIGKITNLRKMACGFLKALLTDGGREIFNDVEKAFSKSADQTRYYVNGKLLYDMANRLIKQSYPMAVPKGNTLTGILNQLRGHFQPVPHIVIRQRENASRAEAREKIKHCIEILHSGQEFSESVFLLVTENQILHPDRVNIYIDLSFLI